MNKKLFNKSVVKKCDVCKYSTLSEDGESVLCVKKGILDRDDICRKFVYDPLKREPQKKAKLPEYSAAEFKL